MKEKPHTESEKSGEVSEQSKNIESLFKVMASMSKSEWPRSTAPELTKEKIKIEAGKALHIDAARTIGRKAIQVVGRILAVRDMPVSNVVTIVEDSILRFDMGFNSPQKMLVHLQAASTEFYLPLNELIAIGAVPSNSNDKAINAPSKKTERKSQEPVVDFSRSGKAGKYMEKLKIGHDEFLEKVSQFEPNTVAQRLNDVFIKKMDDELSRLQKTKPGIALTSEDYEAAFHAVRNDISENDKFLKNYTAFLNYHGPESESAEYYRDEITEIESKLRDRYL